MFVACILKSMHGKSIKLIGMEGVGVGGGGGGRGGGTQGHVSSFFFFFFFILRA